MPVDRIETRRVPTPREDLRDALREYGRVVRDTDHYDGLTFVGTFQRAMIAFSHFPDATPEVAATALYSMAVRGSAAAQRAGDEVTARMLQEDADTFGIASGGYPRAGIREEVINVFPPSHFEITEHTRPDGSIVDGQKVRVFKEPGRTLLGYYALDRSSIPSACGIRVAMNHRLRAS